MLRLEQVKTSTFVNIAWQIALRIGFTLACIYWRLRRPQHEGVLVAIHVDESLLLLRSSYRTAWNFPGGGVRQGETHEAAARRELAEEIGFTLDVPLRPMGTACGLWAGRRDRVVFFMLRLDRMPPLRLDNREIIDAQLVSSKNLGDMLLTGPVCAYVEGRLSPVPCADLG